MANINANNLTTIASAPSSTDSIIVVNRDNNEGKIIDYNLLADAILEKLTSKTYSGLNTTSKILTEAINELDSNVSSLNSGLTIIHCSDTITLPDGTVSEQNVTVDVSSHVPSDKTLYAIIPVNVGNYALPYYANGVPKTYIFNINTSGRNLIIKNLASAWNNYSFNYILIVG